MNQTIECRVFDDLDEACEVYRANTTFPMEFKVAYEIRCKVENFIEQFLMQFFRNGYGLNIDGINEVALNDIKKHFHYRRTKPERMIGIFESSLPQMSEIDTVTYTPTQETACVLSFAMKDFINSMLQAFIQEDDRILNATEVKARINIVLPKIQSLP